MKKIAIVGRPKAGKTTFAKKLAAELGIPLIHTDDLIGQVAFSEADKELLKQVKDLDAYIVEGVQVARMLRTANKDKSWKPDKLFVIENTGEVERHHRGLASLCGDPVQEWIAQNPDVEVETIKNDFGGQNASSGRDQKRPEFWTRQVRQDV